MSEQRLSNSAIATESEFKSAFGFWLGLGGSLIASAQLVRHVVVAFGWPIFFNDSFAFSINMPMPLMVGLYIGAVLFISHHLYFNWHRLYPISKFGFTLIVAGGFSNFFERMILGHVADYIYIATGVLNVADFFILFGIVLIFIQRDYKPSASS